MWPLAATTVEAEVAEEELEQTEVEEEKKEVVLQAEVGVGVWLPVGSSVLL